MPSTARNTVRRWFAYFWRLRTLHLADAIAADSPPGLIQSRPFGDFELFLDVSRSNAQRLLYLDGPRFLVDRSLICSLLRPGMHVVDVGANIGYFMLLVRGTIGAGGHVTCFEPDVDNLRELRMNIEENRLQNVKLIEAAVGAADGTVNLQPGLNSTVSAQGSRSVRAVTLDSAITEPVDLIKIDVEGYEGHVLAGARGTIEKYHPVLLVEIHPQLLSGYTEAQILETLREQYASVKFYALAESGGWIGKINHRYFGGRSTVEIEHAATRNFVETGRTYWAVCRNSP